MMNKTLLVLVLVASLAITAQAQCGGNSNGCSACPSTYDNNSATLNTNVYGGGPWPRFDGTLNCKDVPNPDFVKACDVNVVLVLDESGSIKNYRNDVVIGAKAFWTAMGDVIKIGGTAQLGLIEFNEDARLVQQMQALTPTYINTLNNYIDSSSGGTAGYKPQYCTDWGEAMQLVRDTQWNSKPDIVVWFTDGKPTTWNGNCQSSCSPFGSSMGPACYHAAIVKQDLNVKIFLVGVGGVSDAVQNVRDVTGPTNWDQQLSTFGTADHITNPDLANLGAIFYAVAKGLCPCLQEQPPCGDAATSNGCASSSNNYGMQFEGRIEITAPATSTVYPPGSILSAKIAYDWTQQPVQVAYEFYTDPVATPNPTTERTDIHNPCQVTRKTLCSSGCYTVNDNKYLPRFFKEVSDTSGADNTNRPLQCTNGGYTKTWGIPGQVAPPESVKYVWFVNNARPWVICAAELVDGTVIEFRQEDDVTMAGVNQRQPAFNFNPSATCTAPLCGLPAEIVFVVDQTNKIPVDEWDLWKDYISAIVDTFATDSGVQFGSWMLDGNGDARAVPDINTKFEANPASFKNTISSVDLEGRSAFWDQLVVGALNHFWSGPATSGTPRYLIALVGGASRGNPDDFTAFQTLRDQLGVEAWAIGIGEGAAQTGILTGIASTNGYSHTESLGSATLLAANVPFAASRLCPTGDLCKGNCNGLCTCVDECKCPRCTTTPCHPRTCDDTSAQTIALGCTGDVKNCNDGKACTDDSCRESDGVCLNVNITGCACTCNPPNLCQIPTCDTSSGNPVCIYTPVNCTQTSKCFVRQCDPSTGECVDGAPINCDDGDSCTIDTCTVTDGCVHTPFVCQVDSPCNRTNGCDGTGPEPICEQVVIETLLDFCGKCRGTNEECFFPDDSELQDAGVAVGVIVGVVIAAVIAALLIFFLTRKGYQYYQAKSNMGLGNAKNNDLFKGQGLSGDNVR